jgi:hypothetical protein
MSATLLADHVATWPACAYVIEAGIALYPTAVVEPGATVKAAAIIGRLALVDQSPDAEG